jgi:RimJ/RimL family protein N-acetyltransferase
MAERFVWTKFAQCDLGDSFFDSLKSAYDEFPKWFGKKADVGEEALVATDDEGIVAFVYLKLENEAIKLKDGTLPAASRLKIGTFKMAERFQGQRVGEGAMGVALWHWQSARCNEIYATIFDEQQTLISLFERFGFRRIGENDRGEQVYPRSRSQVDYSNPYTSFPFIRPDFTKAGIIPVE